MDCEPTYKPSLNAYYTGRERLEAGDAPGALTALNESWTIRPHATTAYHIAVALKLLERTAESHQWLARAYELNPHQNMIATSYATTLHTQGRLDEARDVLRRTLANSPTYGPAKTLLASLPPE